MNAVTIRPVASDELKAEGEAKGDVILLTLSGAAELGAKELLDEFLGDVFAASDGVTTVEVDIRPLEYMNSSSFKSFLTWIVKVRELPEERRHRILFLSNPAYHWQKRSLHSLVSMGGDLVDVEEREQSS